MKRGITINILILSSMLILAASFVFAAAASEPTGPDTITYNSSRPTANSIPVVQAEAGNVTALVITQERVTEAWQAYYGNVTGTIVLDDGDNVTFYDWSLPSPTGEVFASNGSSVTWSKVYCLNVSGGISNASDIPNMITNTNGTQIELDFGINVTDADGLNETFNDTFTGNIDVGAVNLDATDGCSMTHPFQDENHNTDWEEILLSDNTSIIFTSIINQNADSYKTTGSETADFQMLVLEDGHVGSESTATNYYFYVELS